MLFKEKINATAGQLVKELEHHLEVNPGIGSNCFCIGWNTVTGISINNCSMDYQGNLIDYVSLEIKEDEKELSIVQVLEILKNIDASTGVLVDHGDEYESENDSGLRNMEPEDDGSFIRCEENESELEIFGVEECSEIDCLYGIYQRK